MRARIYGKCPELSCSYNLVSDKMAYANSAGLLKNCNPKSAAEPGYALPLQTV